MIFSYSAYRKFLRYMQDIQRIVPLGQWDGSNAIILRHDVDIDLEAARRLALVEADSGVRSSFFILTTSNFYNPASSVNRRKLAEMADLGAEIGLHFDPAVYGEVDRTVLACHVDREAAVLSSITGKPVESVSLHNPAICCNYPIFDGYRNAYAREIFSDDAYLSDSRMDFRGKEPYEFVRQAVERPVQILLHPIHYSENGDSYPDLFHRMLRGHIGEIDREARLNATYARQVPGSLLDYLVFRERPR